MKYRDCENKYFEKITFFLQFGNHTQTNIIIILKYYKYFSTIRPIPLDKEDKKQKAIKRQVKSGTLYRHMTHITYVCNDQI